MNLPRALSLAIPLAAWVAASAAFPDRFDAHYTLHAGNFEVGTTHISLSPMGDGRFEYTTLSRSTGVATLLGRREVRERSVWERAGARIRSLRYDYRREGNKERHVEVVFDWNAGRVTNHVNGETWHMTVPDPTFDRQNHILALMGELESGAQPSSYQVADGGKLKTYRLHHRGRQRIATALGEFDTVIVERAQPGSERTTTFWFAPALGYLPVQIEHRESSGSILVHIRAVSGFPGRQENG